MGMLSAIFGETKMHRFTYKRFFLIALMIFANAANAVQLTLTGPALPNDIQGHRQLGIVFSAIQDVTLKSFIFNNQGSADVITLKDENGNTLETYNYAGGDPVHQVNINWPLLAGQKYFLSAQNQSQSNGKWGTGSFPVSNGHIKVEYGKSQAAPNGTLFWFSFTNLVTEGPDVVEFDPENIDGLGLQAVIETVEKGNIKALWFKGGEATTDRGDKVIWGYFYANPADVSWGSINNPEIYVKVWFDVSGRIDVNYFHVSVPRIQVHTSLKSTSTSPDLSGITNLTKRYIRHTFDSNGVGFAEENDEDGVSPTNVDFSSPDPVGYSVINGLDIGAMIKRHINDGGGYIEGEWQQGGASPTARGDEVVWGYFNASPQDVAWGNVNNPEVFVKIWFDVSGRIDVNFFHVSVPEIGIYSSFQNSNGFDQRGVTILQDRYTRHEFHR